MDSIGLDSAGVESVGGECWVGGGAAAAESATLAARHRSPQSARSATQSQQCQSQEAGCGELWRDEGAAKRALPKKALFNALRSQLIRLLLLLLLLDRLLAEELLQHLRLVAVVHAEPTRA